MDADLSEELITQHAVARAARQAMIGALGGDFSVDPLVSAAMSRCFSVIGSLIQRHGLLIQRTVADALVASGRFDVYSNVQVPLTEAANDLLAARNAPDKLATIRLQSDARAVRLVTLDLLVVEPEVGWAGGYDVKRGNGATDSRKRRPLEHDLRGVGMVLSDHLVKLGYSGITDVTTGIIDYYGFSNFSRELKVLGGELDEHFGVPVTAHVEALTEALRVALQAELPDLLRPAIQALPGIAPAPPAEPVIGRVNTRPTGPRPRRGTPTTH